MTEAQEKEDIRWVYKQLVKWKHHMQDAALPSGDVLVKGISEWRAATYFRYLPWRDSAATSITQQTELGERLCECGRPAALNRFQCQDCCEAGYRRFEEAEKMLKIHLASKNYNRLPLVHFVPVFRAMQSYAEAQRIHADHPVFSGQHELYAEAMRLVGQRHEKRELVDLVHSLLLRLSIQNPEADISSPS